MPRKPIVRQWCHRMERITSMIRTDSILPICPDLWVIAPVVHLIVCRDDGVGILTCIVGHLKLEEVWLLSLALFTRGF